MRQSNSFRFFLGCSIALLFLFILPLILPGVVQASPAPVFPESDANTPSNVCGTLASDTIWDLSAGGVYTVTCQVTVPPTVQLTIAAGVTVKFQDSTSLVVTGILMVNGTAAQPVLFTSALESPYAGSWHRIGFNPGSTGNIRHAIIEYAGQATFPSVQVEGGSVNVEDSVIRYSGAQGIRSNVWMNLTNNQFIGNHSEALRLNSPAGSSNVYTITGNTGYDNDDDTFFIEGSTPYSLSLGENPGLPYAIQGVFRIPAGSTLIVGEGARFEIGMEGLLTGAIEVEGTLDVNGSYEKGVAFTGIESVWGHTPGSWWRIYIKPGGVASLDYASIDYAGSGTANLYVEDARLDLNNSQVGWSIGDGVYAVDSLVTINASTFHDNARDGVRVLAESQALWPVIANNEFVDNASNAIFMRLLAASPSTFSIAGNSGNGNGINGILVEGVLADTTLTSNPGLDFVFQTLSIPYGITLNVQAGTVVKLDQAFSNGGSLITVNGSLNLDGSVDRSVVFTSLQDDTSGGDTNNDGGSTAPSRGDWRGIVVNPGGSLTLNYAQVRYAGYEGVAAIQVLGGTATLNKSQVTDNLEQGIYYEDSIPYLTDNTFSRNGMEAVTIRFLSGSCTGLIVKGNTGIDNGMNGIVINASLGAVTFSANPGLPYIVEALTVNPGSTVQMEAGSVFKLSHTISPNGTLIQVYGTLIAQGTESVPVVFTSLYDKRYDNITIPIFTTFLPIMTQSDSVSGMSKNIGHDIKVSQSLPGDWRGIVILAGGHADLDYTVIQYAGYTEIAQLQVLGGTADLNHVTVRDGLLHGIYVEDSSQIVIRDSTVSDNLGDGLRIYGNQQYLEPVVQSNEFSRNGEYGMYLILNAGGIGHGIIAGNTGSGNGLVNGIYVEGYITDASSQWDPNPDFPYVVWTLNINPRAKLTLLPGVVLKFIAPPDGPIFARGTGTAIISGTLEAVGTLSQNITFTSFWDDSVGGDTNGNTGGEQPQPGDWIGLIVRSGGMTQLEYTNFSYGGSGGWNVWSDGGQVNLNYGGIYYSSGQGIGGRGNVTITYSIIAHNQGDGIRLSGPGSVHWSVITDNGGFGLVDYYVPNPDYQVAATHNYWGAADGPSYDGDPCPFMIPSGSGSMANCRVEWDPYLTASPIP